MSLCLAPQGELAFLIDAIGPGTQALCALEPGEELHVLADALRDERRTVDAGTLRELRHVLTHGATSPLYDGGHPIRALFA